MQNIFSGIRNPAIRYGLIFGIILFILGIVLSFLTGILGTLVSLLSLAAYVGLSFWAGLRASQETSQLRTGLLAGFLTGVFSEVIAGILTLILTFINLDALRQSAQSYATNTLHESASQVNAITNATVINDTLLQLGLNMVIASLLGLIAGAIGGYFGRRRATPPPSDSYQEIMVEPPSKTTQQ